MNENKKIIQAADLNHYGNDQMNRIYGVEGISPTLKTVTGGGREVKILVREATKKGYAEAITGDSINVEHPNSKTRRGRVEKGVAQTVTTSPQQAVVLKNRVRKMTPKEYFRLMGFEDSDVDILIENGISNTQLYKQAGNSIVVDVLEEIFCQIFDSEGEKKLTFTRSQASANRLTNKSDEELEQIKKKLKTALSEDEIDNDNCAEIVGIAYITAKNFISGKTRPSKVTMRKIEKYLEGRDDR